MGGKIDTNPRLFVLVSDVSMHSAANEMMA